MPVFFLYFSSRVELNEVLLLEAIYYVSIVLLEVPSGYFSDRFGRRPTLMIAAGALTGAYITFALAGDFWLLAVAQVALATGLAFNSGSDTSFHFANLQSKGIEEEYGEREARLYRLTFTLGAVSALAGGAFGVVDLRLAYVASAVGAAIALFAAFSFREVQAAGEDQLPDQSFRKILRESAWKAKDRTLGWLFLVVVVATVINHIPYEFYQTYLDQLNPREWLSVKTPFVAGIHMAVVQLVGAFVAGRSTRMKERLGLVPHLLCSLFLQGCLIASMAFIVHPVIAILLLARSVPKALQDAPIRSEVTPRVGDHMRATYLSLQSLVGRLAFACVLVSLSLGVGDEFERVLDVSLAIAAGLILLTAGAAVLLRPREKEDEERA
jgi:MFS family permease